MSQCEEEPIIDEVRFDRLFGENPALLQRIAPVFFSTGEKNLARLTAEIAQREYEAASRTAHSLKGSISNMGGVRSATAAARLEEQLCFHSHSRGEGKQTASDSAITSCLEEFRREYANFSQILQARLPANT